MRPIPNPMDFPAAAIRTTADAMVAQIELAQGIAEASLRMHGATIRMWSVLMPLPIMRGAVGASQPAGGAEAGKPTRGKPARTTATTGRKAATRPRKAVKKQTARKPAPTAVQPGAVSAGSAPAAEQLASSVPSPASGRTGGTVVRRKREPSPPPTMPGPGKGRRT